VENAIATGTGRQPKTALGKICTSLYISLHEFPGHISDHNINKKGETKVTDAAGLRREDPEQIQ
jgi:hypothetical protein